MQIGSFHIEKAYFGSKEITPDNAFIGTIPVVDPPEEE